MKEAILKSQALDGVTDVTVTLPWYYGDTDNLWVVAIVDNGVLFIGNDGSLTISPPNPVQNQVPQFLYDQFESRQAELEQAFGDYRQNNIANFTATLTQGGVI